MEPLKEFLKLIEILLMWLFYYYCPTIIFDYVARSKGHYKLVGMIIGWSLVHGGPGGNFFSDTLFNAIAYGIGVKNANVEDIQDDTLRESLNKVRCSATTVRIC